VGVVSIVTPITAAGPVIPVLVALAEGERPAALQVAGMVCIFAGVMLVSRTPNGEGAERAAGGRRIAAGVGFGLLAAICFGSLFVFVDQAAEESVLWGALVARIAAVALVAGAVIAVRHRVVAKREEVPGLLVIGAGDMTANVLLGAATTLGLLSIAAVLISLHILVTIGLARVVLHERLTPAQRVGVVAATLGAVVLSAA
jgi:drug/metabolite transporter (DMT)-like permease